MAKRSTVKELETKRVNLTKELGKDPKWIRDHKEVTGRFHNFGTAGAGLKMYFRKWPSDNIDCFEFEDGQEYTVPRMVADRLNNYCWKPQHEHAVDANGKKIERIAKKIHQYGFSNTRFSSEDDLDIAPAPNLYVVEQV